MKILDNHQGCWKRKLTRKEVTKRKKKKGLRSASELMITDATPGDMVSEWLD